MTVSIVVVSFNAAADLERCLESLHTAPPATPHDIVVVDNASTDGSVDRIRERWPGLRMIQRATNGGFAVANNEGIRATAGELVLLLNSDTLVPAGAVDRLVQRLGSAPEAAIAGPRLVDGAGRAELSFGPMISPWGELRQKLLLTLRSRVPAVDRWIEQATRREQWVDWVSGAALLIWRRDLEAAGLLDERYFLYTEDVDLCAAVRARSRRVLFTPVAEIVHLKGRSRAAAPTAGNEAYRRSQIAFYEKHHRRWAPVLKAYLRARGALPR